MPAQRGKELVGTIFGVLSTASLVIHLLAYWSSLFILNGVMWYRSTGQAGISPMPLNIQAFTTNSRALWTIGLDTLLKVFTDHLGQRSHS